MFLASILELVRLFSMFFFPSTAECISTNTAYSDPSVVTSTMVEWVDKSNNLRSIMTATCHMLCKALFGQARCSFVDGTRSSAYIKVWGDSQLCSMAYKTLSMQQ